MLELSEGCVREIAREEVLKREMERIRMIAKIDASAQKIIEGSNENKNQ